MASFPHQLFCAETEIINVKDATKLKILFMFSVLKKKAFTGEGLSKN
jgi:hypothetical protein